MDVLIAGGHGKIALILSRLLADGGHTPRGLIRDPAQAADLQGVGARPVVCDLEHDEVDPHVGGAEAIVFAAGAGPGSGPERKRTVDYGAAVKCVDAAERLGVRRFVIVSSIGAHDPERGPGSMQPDSPRQGRSRQRSSRAASSGTVVRPAEPHGRAGVQGAYACTPTPVTCGPVPREDVARPRPCSPCSSRTRASASRRSSSFSATCPSTKLVRAMNPGRSAVSQRRRARVRA
jgi:hypothetical protein